MKRLFWVPVAAIVGMALTAALGVWQWQRGSQRDARQAALDAQQALPLLPARALADPAAASQLLHRRIRLQGQWAVQHTVYLDNRQMHGRPGFYVVTPLLLQQPAGVAVLVQRGWIPRDFLQRERLAPVATPTGWVEIEGRIAPPPARLYAFEAGEGGVIRQNLDVSRLRQEAQLPLLLDVSVQQTGAASEGLQRDWPSPRSGSDKNYGYAFQWWAMSVSIALLYAWFQFIRPRQRRSP